jgi:hypothetical protein
MAENIPRSDLAIKGELRRWTLLGWLGIVSAVMCFAGPPANGISVLFYVGGVFGVALSTFFVVCKGQEIRKAVFLTAASIVAYYCAVTLPLFLSRVLPIWGSGTDKVQMSLIVEGGAIGGFILAAATLILFRDPKSSVPTLLLKACSLSVMSAVLGVLGWSLGPSLGKAIYSVLPKSEYPSEDDFHFCSLYFVWQGSMAVLIGLFVWLGEKTMIPQAAEGPTHGPIRPRSVPRKAFLSVVVVSLLLVVLTVAPLRYRLAVRERAVARKLSSTPGLEGLPNVQEVSADQVLLLKDISGFRPGKPISHWEQLSHEEGFTRPPSVYYGVSYKRIGDDSGVYGGNYVSVSIQRYPNSDWARYFADYPNNIAAHFDDPKHHAVVTKFENKVRTDLLERGPIPSAVPLYYIWPSGNDLITITYNTATENEEFLHEYLEKYPSSIR